MTIPHAMLEFVTARDHRLMRRVNGWNAPKWVRIWVICATRGGEAGFGMRWVWQYCCSAGKSVSLPLAPLALHPESELWCSCG